MKRKKPKSISLKAIDKIIAEKMLREIREQRIVMLSNAEAEHFKKRKEEILKIVNKK